MDEIAPCAEPALDVRARGGGMALEHLGRRLERLRDKLRVALEIREAQQRLAALSLAQILARAAQFEIALRDLETVGTFEDDLQPVAGSLRQRVSEKQDADALARATTDAAAQLMELRETEAFSTLDHHERGVGHVDADFDHRGTDEKLDLAGNEALHHRGLFRGR